MTGQTHMMIGSVVLLLSLLVGIWLVVARRLSTKIGAAHTGALTVVMVVLAIQILAGIDLLSRGLVPATGIPGIIHVVGPIVAFLVGLWALLGPRRRQIRSYIIADHLTFLVAMISFAIGEASRPH